MCHAYTSFTGAGYYSAAGLPRGNMSTVPLICEVCPDGAACLGATFAPIAKVGYGQLEISPHRTGQSQWRPFYQCTHVSKCGGTNNDGCDCLGGTVARDISGELYAVPVRCGVGYDNASSLCSRCAEGSNFAVHAGPACKPCKWGGKMMYLLIAVCFTLIWFPSIRALTSKFESSEITINFIQFLG